MAPPSQEQFIIALYILLNDFFQNFRECPQILEKGKKGKTAITILFVEGKSRSEIKKRLVWSKRGSLKLIGILCRLTNMYGTK